MHKRNNRYIVAYASLFVALVLQTTVIKNIAIFGIAPTLLLVFAVCFSLINGGIPSTVFAGIAGLLLDASGSRAFGLNTLMMIYLSLGVSRLGRETFQDSPRSAVILSFTGTLLYEMVYFILNFLILGSGLFWYALWRIMLIESLYNAVLAIPVYFYCNKFVKLVASRSLLN